MDLLRGWEIKDPERFYMNLKKKKKLSSGLFGSTFCIKVVKSRRKQLLDEH
jgi:hypothetical protein